jgi:NAD(P)H-flavin reductase
MGAAFARGSFANVEDWFDILCLSQRMLVLARRGPYIACRMIITNIIDIRKFGDDKAVISLKAPDGFAYRAGQYVDLGFGPHAPRSYSIGNAPGGDFLEIHIRDNGRAGSASHAVQALSIGDVVTLQGPYGENFPLAIENLPLLLIAGGMGIAPLKALAEDIMARDGATPITFYWGVRGKEDAYLEEWLEQAQKSHALLSYKISYGDDLIKDIARHDDLLNSHQVYVAGPSAMAQSMTPLLISKGARKDRLFIA